MARRWQCRYTTDDFINEMAREMYLRDWKRNMRNAHWIIRAFHMVEPDYENHKSYMISEWIEKQSKIEKTI